MDEIKIEITADKAYEIMNELTNYPGEDGTVKLTNAKLVCETEVHTASDRTMKTVVGMTPVYRYYIVFENKP